MTIRRFAPRWLGALTVALSLLAPAPLVAQQVTNLSSRAPLLDEVARLVQQNIFDDTLADRAVQAHAEAVARLPSELDDAAIDRAIADYLADLGVSHLGRYEPPELAYYELIDIFYSFGFARQFRRVFPEGVAYEGIGVRLGEDPDGLGAPITVVYDGGPGDRAGLSAGERLLTVQGAPANPVQAFGGLSGEKATLEVRGLDGHVRETSVAVARIQPNELFRESITASARILPNEFGLQIGYLRILSWAGRDMQAAVVDALGPDGPLADADGLILDLRQGWGGAQPRYTDFFTGSAPPSITIARDGTQHVLSARWDRPLVVLIGPDTRSGKEIVAYGLQQAGVPLVGEQTAGAVLAGLPHLLSDDSLLVIPFLDVVVDGVRLEGAGVEPDIPVLPGPPGEDTQLEVALDVLARMVAEGN